MPTLSRPDVDLHYDLAGDGEPVVLIQGVGMGGGAWEPQVEALKPRFRALVFDNRGLGRSAPCRGPVSVEAMADDVLALMDAEGWPSAHVVGHSMGGVIAQQVALARRERVRSLALLCTFHRGPAATHLSWRLAWLGLRTSVGPAAMRRRAFVDLVSARTVRESRDRDAEADELSRLAGRDLAASPAIVMRQIGALRRHDALSRLGELRGIPTLVVSADEDPIALPAFGERLAEAIPAARFELLRGASHAAPIHDAARVNALLSGFLERAAEGRAGCR